jgi:hypothetical protein
VKLTITVTDEQVTTTTTSGEVPASAPAALSPGSPDGRADTPEIHDGGPVPDELLAMEAQVAAGLKEVPGRIM